MIDFHTHVLPGIDDGSKDIEMTERMLEMELAMGVSTVYATPHFYAHRRSVQSFLERRDSAYSKVKELLEKRPELPAIKTGAEVYYFSGMGRAEQLPSLCIEGTDILLLELPFTQWHSDIARDIEEIMDRHRLRIVLAHLERYEAFQKDRHVWNRIVEMPLTIQLNCEDLIDKGTFLRRNHRYKLSFDLLAEFDNVIIGSDCHNLTERKPNLEKGREAIREMLGEARLEQLDKYTGDFLGKG